VADDRGFVGDLATTSGLADLYEVLAGMRSAPARDILLHGYTLRPALLREHLSTVRRKMTSPTRKTVATFAALLGRCGDVAIVSNGEGGA